MSKYPDLVESGKSISLAALGGEKLLATPKKEPVKRRRVVVMPKPTDLSDPFPPDEDALLAQINMDNAASGEGASGNTSGSATVKGIGPTDMSKESKDGGSSSGEDGNTN